MQEITKQPSKELTDLINDWADSYIKSTELPAKITEQAKTEGLSKEAIRTLIEIALRDRGLSERRIREVLPAELKEQSKMRSIGEKEAKSETLRHSTAAKALESDSVGEKEAKSGSFEPDETEHKLRDVGIVLDEEEDNEPPDPNQVPDAVFTAKKLAKALDEINVLNVKLEQERKTVAQLQEAVKKDAFKPATESMNVFQKKNIAVPMAQTELRKLMAQGWHFINLTAEFVS